MSAGALKHRARRQALTASALRQRVYGLTAASYDEMMHPRGRDGKWIEKLGFVKIFDTGDDRTEGHQGQVTAIVPNKKTGKADIKVEVFDDDGQRSGTEITLKPENIEQSGAKGRLGNEGADERTGYQKLQDKIRSTPDAEWDGEEWIRTDNGRPVEPEFFDAAVTAKAREAASPEDAWILDEPGVWASQQNASIFYPDAFQGRVYGAEFDPTTGEFSTFQKDRAEFDEIAAKYAGMPDPRQGRGGDREALEAQIPTGVNEADAALLDRLRQRVHDWQEAEHAQRWADAELTVIPPNATSERRADEELLAELRERVHALEAKIRGSRTPAMA